MLSVPHGSPQPLQEGYIQVGLGVVSRSQTLDGKVTLPSRVWLRETIHMIIY